MVIEVRGKRAKGIALLLAILGILAAPGVSRSSPGKVDISARSLVRVEGERLVIAKGDVEIHYQDVTLKADEVKLHTDTKDLVATGNVVLKENKGSLTCDKLEFNLDTKKGVAMRARGFFSPFYYLRGREIRKVGPKKYIVEHGSFTTCKTCSKKPNAAPDWSFKSSHMEVELGKTATIHNVSGWIKKIPVIYAPYLKIPLQNERKTGFLIPRVGYSKTKGSFVKIPFYWAISDYQDATFTLIPYSRGTIRGKAEYRYNLETGKGFLSYDYIRKESERTQWSLWYNHDQRLPFNWRLLAKADVQSDNEYKKEDQDNFERRSQQFSDSFVMLSKSWGNNYLSAEFRHKEDLENNYGERTIKMPEIRYSLIDKRLGNSPLFFNLDSSFLHYSRRQDSSDIDWQLSRLDFHPQIALPYSPRPWISITPYYGFRETIYTKRLSSDGGLEKGVITRSLYNAGVTMRGPLAHKYFSFKGNKLKHYIVPEVKYTYIPREDQKDIPEFDEIDNIKGENKINYSLTQYLYKIESNNHVIKMVKFRVEQEFYIDKARSNHPNKEVLSPVWIDLDTHLAQGVEWNHQLTYDVYGNGVTRWDTHLSLHPPGKIWGLSGSYHYSKDPDEKFLILEPSLVLGPMYLWGAIRYDAERNYMAEKEARLTWHSECWEISLSFLSVDNRGNDAKDETKFSFLVTLKGLGTIGRKR